MPRVYTRKARKDIYLYGLKFPNPDNKSGYSFDRSKPSSDDDDKVIVKAGETYYAWSFKNDVRERISVSYPNRKQLTQNEFLLAQYDFEDRLGAIDFSNVDELKSTVEEIIDEIRQLSDEQDEKLNNMPESLQSSDIGMLLEERRDNLSQWADDIEAIDLDWDSEEETSWEEFAENIKEQLNSCSYPG